MANGNWVAAVSGGVGTTTLTDAEFQALVAANGLVAGAEYYVSDLPARWVATDGNSYDGIAFVQNGVTYFGDEATAAQTEIDLEAGTWATRPTTFDVAGVVYYRRMTDIGTAPGGTVMAWLSGTSTEWGLVAPLRLRLRGAGTTTTSAQYPTNTRHALPAGFLAGCSRFDVNVKFDQTDETSTLSTWRLKLGAAGTASDATLLTPSGATAMNAGDNQRAHQLSFNIESATTVRMDGISNATAVGWQTSAVTSVADTDATGGSDAGVATLAGSDDTSDALYLGVDYTMGVSSTALTTTLIVTFYPL